MNRKDKYGRGSAAANGDGFVDLTPGDTFARGKIAMSHFDKKAVDETREKPRVLRVFSAFVFAGKPLVATITIKLSNDGLRLYAIEALDIMRDEGLEVHLAAEPRQFKTTRLLLEQRIAYYVGEVNRTRPAFVNLDEPFTIDRCADLILEVFELLS